MTIGRLIKKLKKYPHRDKVIVYVDNSLYDIAGTATVDPIPEYKFEKDVIEIYCELAPIEPNDEEIE